MSRRDFNKSKALIDATKIELAAYDINYIPGVVSIVNNKRYINNEALLLWHVNHPYSTLKFSSDKLKYYYFTAPITFCYGVSIEISYGACVTRDANLNDIWDYFISFSSDNLWRPKRNQQIHGGGTIDGKKCVKDLVRLNSFYVFNFHTLNLKNANENYVITRTEGPNPANLYLYNCDFENGDLVGDKSTDYDVMCVGINANCSDSVFTNCSFRDINIGVRASMGTGGACVFIGMHPWTLQKERLPYTIAFQCMPGSSSRWHRCDSDTMQIGWDIKENTEVYLYDHCKIYSNGNLDVDGKPMFPYSAANKPVALNIANGHWYVAVNELIVDGAGYKGLDGSNNIITVGIDMCNQQYVTGYVFNTKYSASISGTPTVTKQLLDVIDMPFPTSSHMTTPSMLGETIAGNGTYGTPRVCRWGRIGLLVGCTINLKVTFDNTVSGDVYITGLQINSIEQCPVLIGKCIGFPSGNIPAYAEIVAGTTKIKLFKSDGSGGYVPINGTALRGLTIEINLAPNYVF